MMSKKFAKMSKDKRAEMGVGTMIIFIAMVLVAAVAASVLISTANTVREQATQTGNDAIQGVASGFDIKYVKGTVGTDANANKIVSMDVYVQLAAGSPAIRLDDVIISVTSGTVSGELIVGGDKAPYEAATGTATAPAEYGAALIPPADDTSAFATYGTVSQGDLLKITITHIDTTALAAEPDTPVTIKIMPAKGSSCTVMFTIPPVLATGTVNLR